MNGFPFFNRIIYETVNQQSKIHLEVSNMKKLITGIAAMALTLSLCSTSALAAGHGRHCIDANKDGICDYYHTSCQYVDKDNDGICDTCGKNVCGNGYVDADGDGICDHYTTGTSKKNVKVQRGCHGGSGKNCGGHHSRRGR